MTKIRPTSREAIIEAGFEVFSRNPGASLEEVAKRAGVGRATLHRHFPSREKLMIGLARIANEELDEAVEVATADATSHTQGLKQALSAMIPLADRQWFLTHEPVDEDEEVRSAYRTGRDELAAEIDAARQEGTFASDIPTIWLVEVYENLIYTAWTLVRNGDATAGQASDLAWRTLTQGLKGTDR